MKKWTVAALLLLGVAGADAQVRVGVNVNIGSQPDWGPVGYERADYYYLPDIESYYYVPTGQFIYLSNGRWTFAAHLPSRYSRYDLYSGYKVVINRPYAYRYYNDDRIRYSNYRIYNGKQKWKGKHYKHGKKHKHK
ncbi:MAG: hypothetical protein H7Y42_17255 [Chitinophagaceae bacterium]|nr:hypothetical protein [Chitinophagaceae bacterium]